MDSNQLHVLRKIKVNRIYRRLEKALCKEVCTYEEAKLAVDKLKEIYFNRKVSNFLCKQTIQEIADQSSIMPH
ncbi:MAG: hypothetical protein NC231_10955 [Bacillus sp. (in: Bacteria)]|nr:hypothetical protein [Bacillus sp. (in: firmicutes)]MCM1427331.1 hypothetical protein [Eubacterium sp.]